jgi:hypothetical protein
LTLPPRSEVDQRDTHRLIPAQFADDGASVLSRLSDDDDVLDDIFELDNATNDRLLAESGLLPGIDSRELVFGIPSYRIINAAFCHRSDSPSRFSSSDRNAWYAGFETDTSQAEVAYHKQRLLQETAWEEEEVADYVDYLADFHADFHDIRNSNEHADCLSPTSYAASQQLAASLLDSGSSGIVYPSVRRTGGTCIACFRPVLVTHVRQGQTFRFVFPNSTTFPAIQLM